MSIFYQLQDDYTPISQSIWGAILAEASLHCAAAASGQGGGDLSYDDEAHVLADVRTKDASL